MSIADFNPEHSIVLDWFGLTKKIYPDLDWSDKDSVIEKTEALLSALDFEIIPGYLIVKAELSKINAQKLGVHKPFKLMGYIDTLDWLLPSGIVIKAPTWGTSSTNNNPRYAIIEYEDKKFMEYFDGSFICITPEIDARWVKVHWGESVTVKPDPVEIEYLDESIEVI